MKKLFTGIAVVIVILALVFWFAVANIDSIVKRVIESAGSEALGTEVRIAEVEIHLSEGAATIRGFRVANPQGFSDNDMMSFDELSVVLDISSINQDILHINSVFARSPFVRYETLDGRSNLEVVSAGFASDEPAPATETSATSPLLAIDRVDVEDISGVLVSGLLTRDVTVNLGDIHLRELEGTPQQIAEQVMAPILSQLSVRGANALVSALGEFGVEGVGTAARALQEQAGERLNQLQEQGGAVLEGVGNLFRRNQE